MTTLDLIVANSTHRPLRTLLTIGSLVVASLMFVATFALLENVSIPRSDYPSPHVVVVPYGDWMLPLAAVSAVKRLPGVLDVDYQHRYVGRLDAGGEPIDYSLWGVSDGWPLTYPRTALRVSRELYAAWKGERRGVMATRSLAARYHWLPGAAVEITTDDGKRVSGLYLGAVDGTFYGVILHYENVMMSLAAGGPSDITRMAVACEPARCATLPAAIDQLFETSSASTFSMSQEQFFDSFAQGGSTIPDLCAIVGFAVIAITAVIIGCTLSITLRQRGYEIATLRALGFTRLRVLLVLLGEAALAATVGGLIGAVVPYAITALHPVSLGVEVVDLVVSPQLALAGVALSLAMGISIALWPVLRSLSVPIVKGLA